MIVNTYPKSSTQKLSDNFEVREFSCHGSGCCSTVLIDPKLVEILQKIRDHFGKPVYINSGYRCAKHNKAVGGVSGSYHLKGMAADITVKDVAPAEVAKYAESIGVLGIGLYESNKSGYFVHVDTRTKKSFWYGSGQERRTTFGGTPPVTTAPASKKVDPARSYDERKVGAYEVTANSGLRLRAGAATNKAVLTTLKKGTIVQCYGYHTASWLYVEAPGGKVGFCHSSYLTKV